MSGLRRGQYQAPVYPHHPRHPVLHLQRIFITKYSVFPTEDEVFHPESGQGPGRLYNWTGL